MLSGVYQLTRVQGEPADEWYNILHIKNGQYATFKLNNEFSIIDNSEREVSAPSPGDYYNIPFVSDPLQLESFK